MNCLRSRAWVAGVAGDGKDQSGLELRDQGRGLSQSLAGGIKEDAVHLPLAFDQLLQFLANVTGDETGMFDAVCPAVGLCPGNALPVVFDPEHLGAA